MRLVKQAIVQKDGSGTATLYPEEPEDMVSGFTPWSNASCGDV